VFFKGLIAAVYSTLNKHQKVDCGVLPEYCNYLVKNGVSGAFVNGSTGDFVSLGVEERKKIIEGWSAFRSSDFRLINHVGHTSLSIAKDLAKHSVGRVDAISAIAPYYFKITTTDKLVEYCREISDSAPGVPFYYYHIPVLSGANLKMSDFIVRAAKEIKNFAGIKFTQEDLSDFKKASLLNKDVNVLFGVDELFFNSLELDASGWVGSTYNHIAPLYFEIKSLFKKKEGESAKSLQKKAVLFVQTLNSFGGYNGAAKGFMKVLGVDCGPSRFPHNSPDDNTLRSILENLKSFGLERYFGKNA
jgi:N-acetylneuraminate lyase